MTIRGVILAVLLAVAVTPAAAQSPESRDMRLVGQHALQARSAYQPLIVKQGDRFDRGYVYIVDRAGTGLHVLELTGAARAIANLP